jgi:hypothetical protein
MPNHAEKKLTYKEWLEEADEDIRHIVTGNKATEKYAEVLCRIADALEHQVINATMMLLAAPSPEFPAGRTADLYIGGHLASCSACTMIRKAKPIDVNAIIQAQMSAGMKKKILEG